MACRANYYFPVFSHIIYICMRYENYPPLHQLGKHVLRNAHTIIYGRLIVSHYCRSFHSPKLYRGVTFLSGALSSIMRCKSARFCSFSLLCGVGLRSTVPIQVIHSLTGPSPASGGLGPRQYRAIASGLTEFVMQSMRQLFSVFM